MTRCLYEVLGVNQTATPDQLRTAYKRMVMVWHPDKNLHRVEEATARFTEIQNAYDTLNDSNERAWYDAHRESLVQGMDASSREPRSKSSRGKAESSHSRTEDLVERPEEINLWPYFAPDVFSGFGDSGRGFFHVYREIFDLLHKQEQEALRSRGRVDRSDPPPIGNFYSSWETVKTFYEHWTTFFTVKDYAWFDEYNPSTAPDDRTRKWMERENNKIRKRHKEEFEERVRKLAAHARKRDPRVLERKQLKKEEEEKKKKEKAEDDERRQKEKEREREHERDKERMRKEEKERERREKEKERERVRAKELKEEKEQKRKLEEEREREKEKEEGKRKVDEERERERERKEEKRKLEEEQRRKRERRKERERDYNPIKVEEMALQENLRKLQEKGERSRQRLKQIDEVRLRKAMEEREKEERLWAHTEGDKDRPLVREWSLGNERDWSRDRYKKSKDKDREKEKEGSSRSDKEGSTHGRRDRGAEHDKPRENEKVNAKVVDRVRSRDATLDKGKANQEGASGRKDKHDGAVDRGRDMPDGSTKRQDGPLDEVNDMRDQTTDRGKDKQGDTVRGLHLRRTVSHKISAPVLVSRSPKDVTVQIPLRMSEPNLDKRAMVDDSACVSLNEQLFMEDTLAPGDEWSVRSPSEPSGEAAEGLSGGSTMGNVGGTLVAERATSPCLREMRNGGWGMNFLGEVHEGGKSIPEGTDEVKLKQLEVVQPTHGFSSAATGKKKDLGPEKRAPRASGLGTSFTSRAGPVKIVEPGSVWFKVEQDIAADGQLVAAFTSASKPGRSNSDIVVPMALHPERM